MPHQMRKLFPVASVLLLVGTASCTTLGPMPATTGVSMAPAGRPEIEVHAGAVPGYYLSSAVTEDTEGAALRDVGAVLEPDRVLGVPGVFVGGRYAGTPGSGASFEPLLGYRASLGDDRRLGLGVIAYGTHARAAQKQASFSATRAGLEAGGDLRLTPSSQWLELHLDASVAFTGLAVDGSYCLDQAGIYGVDCPDGTALLTDTSAGGVYPSLNAGLALDFARHLDSAFHGARLALGVAGGTMPRAIAGEQRSARLYAAGGATLSVAFGAAH